MSDVIISFIVGIIGALIGAWGNWILEERKYTLATQQIITEKRVEALQYLYDAIQIFIEVSGIQLSEDPQNIAFYYPQLLSDTDIKVFEKKLDTALKNHFWYSIRLKNKVIEFSNSVKMYIAVIGECHSVEERKARAPQVVDNINQLQRELQELIYFELQNMSNFDDFTKENICAIKGKG